MSQLTRPIYNQADVPSRDDEAEKEFFQVLESPEFKRIINFAILNKIRQSKSASNDWQAVGYLHQIQCLTEILDCPEAIIHTKPNTEPSNEDRTLEELERLH